MGFIYAIIDLLIDAANLFSDLYWETRDWPTPFWYVASLFRYLNNAFVDLAYEFQDFADWLEWAENEIDDILSWPYIRNKIREWLDGIEDLVDWFAHWVSNVVQIIDLWWDSTLDFVQGLIAAAVQGLADLLEAWDTFWNITFPDLVGRLGELRSLWDNFVQVILPDLVSLDWLDTWWNSRLAELDTFIDSKLTEWLPFYNELVAIWSSITGFFADPLEWLWGKFADWFLGPEG